MIPWALVVDWWIGVGTPAAAAGMTLVVAVWTLLLLAGWTRARRRPRPASPPPVGVRRCRRTPNAPGLSQPGLRAEAREGARDFAALRDAALRRGHGLLDAEWIARRAAELGGDESAITRAAAQVAAARGDGWGK